jgi:hypothetical protein
MLKKLLTQIIWETKSRIEAEQEADIAKKNNE